MAFYRHLLALVRKIKINSRINLKVSKLRNQVLNSRLSRFTICKRSVRHHVVLINNKRYISNYYLLRICCAFWLCKSLTEFGIHFHYPSASRLSVVTNDRCRIASTSTASRTYTICIVVI